MATKRIDSRSGRKYSTPLGEFPSVTTILNVINKPFLIPWALKEAREATLTEVWKYLLANSDAIDENDDGFLVETAIYKDEFRKIITESVKESERVKKRAQDLGSLVHGLVECFLKEWLTDPLNFRTIGATYSYVEFLKDFYPQAIPHFRTFEKAIYKEDIDILDSEQTVYHPEQFAGTLDMVGTVKGVPAIIDLKCANQVSYEYWLQTVAYMKAYNYLTIQFDPIKCKGPCPSTGWCRPEAREDSECPRKIKHRFLLRLDKKDPEKYDFIPIPVERNESDWQSFLSCLNLYKSQKAHDRGKK